MASNKVTIEFKVHTSRLCDAISRMDPQRVEDLVDGWRVFESNGCEMVEVKIINGQLVAFPSYEFTQYCIDRGVPL